MNLYELDLLLESLRINHSEDKELISFYENKRRELIKKINKEVNKKLNTNNIKYL